MHIRVSVAYLEIAQSYISAVFDSYISHLAVDNKNRISAVKNKIRHAAEIEWNGVESGVSSGENSFSPAVLVITSIYSLQRSLSI